MKKSTTPWQRLVAAARQAPDLRTDDAAPYGFSVRVASLAMAAVERPSLQSALNHFSWRALTLALMLMAVSIAANYSTVTSVVDVEHDSDVDPVAEYLTLS
ncbi:MAG: hypothetical protein QM715_02465 [Nibricoccus sp.]